MLLMLDFTAIIRLTQIVANEPDDSEAILLVRLVDDNWDCHCNGRQNEAKENGEVSFVAAATTPFAASAHLARYF